VNAAIHAEIDTPNYPWPRSSLLPLPNEAAKAHFGCQITLAQDPVRTTQLRTPELAELESLHRAESVGADGKARAEAEMAAIATSHDLKASGIAPTAYRNDCRLATCRISADFKSNGEAEDWGMMLTTMSGSTLRRVRTMVINNPDGSFELHVYGARK
jgi:hypothetical protein